MTPPIDLPTLDLNALFRNALHRRTVGGEIDVPLREAVAETVAPEHVAALHAGFSRTIARASEELGGTHGDALHTIVVNLTRFHFNFRWDGSAPGDEVGDDSYVVAGGKVQRLGGLPAGDRIPIEAALLAIRGKTSSLPSSSMPAAANTGNVGGCVVLIAVGIGALAAILHAS